MLCLLFNVEDAMRARTNDYQIFYLPFWRFTVKWFSKWIFFKIIFNRWFTYTWEFDHVLCVCVYSAYGVAYLHCNLCKDLSGKFYENNFCTCWTSENATIRQYGRVQYVSLHKNAWTISIRQMPPPLSFFD